MISLADAETLVAEIERLKGEVTRLEARVEQLNSLAHVDPLVNLPNRRMFIAGLGRSIARVERHGGPAAVLFVDVDGLKAINDGFGHAAGDEALTIIARSLVESVRRSDCVARLSGDEFAILLEETDELSAWQMALRLVEAVVGAEFCLNGTCLPLSVAVGVAMIQVGDDPRSVLERADREMYRLKSRPSLLRA